MQDTMRKPAETRLKSLARQLFQGVKRSPVKKIRTSLSAQAFVKWCGRQQRDQT
jgi:hypothetical protein